MALSFGLIVDCSAVCFADPSLCFDVARRICSSCGLPLGGISQHRSVYHATTRSLNVTVVWAWHRLCLFRRSPSERHRISGYVCIGVFGSLVTLDRLLYYLWRCHPEVGMGDMKLFASLGAWFGMTGLWRILAFSPLLALLSALLVLCTKLGEPFPLGPYPIALALAILVWG